MSFSADMVNVSQIRVYVGFQDLGCTLGQILLHFMIYNTQLMMSVLNMNFKPV